MKYFLLFICFILFCLNTIGQTWSAVGNGVNGRVSCFAIYNNELYVAGQFNNLGGISPFGIMKWNGTMFDTIPGTYQFGSSRIEAMAVFNGELYLGGAFGPGVSPFPSTFTFTNLAKWNGSSFSAVGSCCDNVIYSIQEYNGNLFIGGDLSQGIKRWNGNQLTSLGGGIPGSPRVSRLAVFNGELYAAGSFSFPSINSSCIARWNDTIWNSVGPGGIPGVVYALGIFNNKLFAGGPYFTQAGGVPVNQIASWDGVTWGAEGSGIGVNTAHIFALKEYQNELYVGGSFNIMNGDSMNSITRYDGINWNSVGTGVDSTNIISDTLYNFPGWGDTTYIYAPHTISTFTEFNGELYAGGSFNMIGGVTAHNVAKWTIPVSLQEIQDINSFVIYPNPVSNTLSLELNTKNKVNFIEIYNGTGQLVFFGQYYSLDKIDVSGFSNGLYVIKLKNSEISDQKRFIVNH